MTTVSRARTAARPARNELVAAMLVGGIGALFGFLGVAAVVAGDETIPLDAASLAVAILTAVALVSAVIVRGYPIYGAIGMAIAPLGYLLAFGASWGAWWSTYERAVRTSADAENAFWASMPAMAFFAIAGVLLAVAAILAAYSVLRHGEVDGGVA